MGKQERRGKCLVVFTIQHPGTSRCRYLLWRNVLLCRQSLDYGVLSACVTGGLSGQQDHPGFDEGA
eukprot:scaffold67185_cov30-Tisochrysis_lutea.AAC.2